MLPGILLNNVADIRHSATLLKKGLQHRLFPMNFAKLFRTTFLQNTTRRLFLTMFGYILITLVQS